MPRLEMRTGKLAGKSYELSKAVILGRGDNVGIRVHDIKASREHCRVFIQAGKWVVVDLNSRNGITVNGAKTTRKELVSGDQVAIGETVLAYIDEVAEMESVAPMAMPGEIEVDEIDLGGDATPAPTRRPATRPPVQQTTATSPARSASKPSRKSGTSAKDAAFARARADAARSGKAGAARGGGSSNDVGLNVSDKVLQFSKVDANKTSALSMDLSQYPVWIQIVIVGGGLFAIGAGVWLLFKAMGVTAG